MYKIPKDLDLTSAIGQTVEQVCFGSHQIIIRFSSDIYISIESEVIFNKKGNPTIDSNEHHAIDPKCYVSLLGSTVTDALVTSEDAITFIFSNGDSITLFNSSINYECFQIQLPGRLVVV